MPDKITPEELLLKQIKNVTPEAYQVRFSIESPLWEIVKNTVEEVEAGEYSHAIQRTQSEIWIDRKLLRRKELSASEQDRENFNKVLRGEWGTGEWAPAVPENWPIYEREAGVEPEHVYENTPDYEDAPTTYWFKTKYPDLYLVEIRHKEELAAKWFGIYKKWPPT